MNLRHSLLPLMFSFLLSACDNFGTRDLKPGVSTAAEVRERMGEPAGTWSNENGTTTWEYPKGPSGTATFMVTIGADNVLRAVEQVLSDPYFARVEKGMTREQVRRLLGRPKSVAQFPLKREEVWDWRIEGAAGVNEKPFFNVHFNLDGLVVGTSRTVDPGP